MDQKEKEISDLIADTKDYVNSKLDYMHLKSVEKGAKLFSDLVTNTIVVICFLLAFILLTITLAFFMSNIFKSYVTGFGLVAIIYFLISIIVLLSKKAFLEKFLINTFIKKYFEKSNINDNEK